IYHKKSILIFKGINRKILVLWSHFLKPSNVSSSLQFLISRNAKLLHYLNRLKWTSFLDSPYMKT
ncbi:hypothetical protein BpHYR1_022446, partial [Brachionus plicatilis]